VLVEYCRSKQLVKAIKEVYGPHSEVHKKVRTYCSRCIRHDLCYPEQTIQ
jgi:hypothetical protein